MDRWQYIIRLLTHPEKLDIQGSINIKAVENSPITTEYTAGNETVILADGNIKVKLPKASTIKGRVYKIKNVGTDIVTIDPYSDESIEGNETLALRTQYRAFEIFNDGTEWWILSEVGEDVAIIDEVKIASESISKAVIELKQIKLHLEVLSKENITEDDVE